MKNRTASSALVLCLCSAGLLIPLSLQAEEEATDASYVQRFLKRFPAQDPVPTLEEYAQPARYDDGYMGEDLASSLKEVSNDKGGIAWGLSYRLMSLNDMFRATRDPKYLRANLRCIQAILAATDSGLGKALWNGRVVAAWGCDIYAERGRALFAVHTGITVAPMMEFLQLAADRHHDA